MNDNLTELVFIIDRSGSMAGLESDTIGGFNSLLAKQLQEPGEALVTTVLFDDNYELLHDRVALEQVAPLTTQQYFVRGSTALLDAIGITINKIGNRQKTTIESERAAKVVLVIITDGMENASRVFSIRKIKAMIERQTSTYGWEFIFLGANIDAVETAQSFGINDQRAANFHADTQGIELNFQAVSQFMGNVRTKKSNDNWKQAIDEDFNNRSNKK
jgi:uncharacterized protein YegL